MSFPEDGETRVLSYASRLISLVKSSLF